ncbi:hypothetical protein A2960_00745 [Candidatus Gottesmanbacteria bacterium RIFCSPLOWO2_01_FULL_39_12b]|uniref:Glycosyl transferase family 1 domain-containing protein n=1 Tax=Candidatus Gottesmanbacteria bacterium RIFCSPLOWO2_01_FULL_39_12b TaxID=1798388 RepID=A0A1F6APS3_9BACT|nr:MAG: hypothetical protein A2960_00745 [Candidatus Gottesmanbacteria bacterium RIFCSPLOWO2_01_FULL_39_12b]
MKQIKIALVNPPLPGHKQRGTGTYLEELIKALNKCTEIEVTLVRINSDISKFDLVHYPYYDPFFLTLPLIKIKPTVVTVHDMIPLKFPNYFQKGLRGEIKWLIQRQSLKGAKTIITDSYASKKDIVKFTAISEEKINVIYLGVREEFKVISSQKELDEVRVKYSLPSSFILYVGDVNYNKNIPGIIKSFLSATQKFENIYLVLVGNGFINNSIQLSDINNLISKLRLEEKVIKLGFIDLSDLAGIYNLAKVYLQPSFAEGFGLPILEAMACGCPVVTTNTSSLPELTGEAAIKLDPKNYQTLARSIIELIENASLRDQLIKKGIERAKKFSWDKCSQETIKAYKKALE